MTATPRVLVMTPGALNRYRESGVTLTHLFEGWPPDRITQIHADPAPPPEVAVDRRSYDASGGGRTNYRPLVRRADALRQFATGRSDVGLLWGRIGRRLRGWLEEFPPDVILSQTGNLAFLRLTRRVQEATGAPLVLYAADDWVSDWPANNLGRRIPVVTDVLARTVRREFQALSRSAVGHMAIGDAMAAEYRLRFGGEWQTMPNPVDLDRWPVQPRATAAYSAARPFRVLYSGSLHHLSQLPGVREAADAVAALARAGRPVRFEIATHEGFQYLRHELERGDAVRVVDLVPPEALPRRFGEVDLLFLPVVFDPLHLRYMRLSMPGKVAEYLASGTPTLVYGPRAAAVVQHAESRGWAAVVSERGVTPLQSAILGLLEDPERGRALAARAREVAAREFDQRRFAAAFQATLRAAAVSGRTADG